MLDPTFLAVSGERIRATYAFVGSPSEARDRASSLIVEQTIEFPADLVPDDSIRSEIIGRIESHVEISHDVSRFDISYAVETTGHEFPQLLNVLFGNSSLLPGVKLTEVSLPPSMSSAFGGPRFGLAGLRELFDAPTRPLIATALKPMGSSPERLAQFAYDLAAGGMDMIKDDHSLANQPFAEFAERVKACADAVRRANDDEGTRAIYMPSINAPQPLLDDRVRTVVDAGAGGLLVLPGLTGFDHMRSLATRTDIALPIMGHPAFLGGFVSSPNGGIAHRVIFGTLMRLAGADASIFPNYGGRFSFAEEACREIAEACRTPIDHQQPIWPTPGGGMRLDRVGEMLDFYGSDVVLLIGGDLHRDGALRANAEAFRRAVA
jgi:ribulose-bisphosphate carboxylase large chain